MDEKSHEHKLRDEELRKVPTTKYLLHLGAMKFYLKDQFLWVLLPLTYVNDLAD